jgi:hypothetical protein
VKIDPVSQKTGPIRQRRDKAPNSKYQAPEKFQAPNTQNWSFEVWSFSGAWSLVFGAFERYLEFGAFKTNLSVTASSATKKEQ